MKWALIDENNIVQNVISYDGSSPFQSPDGQSLVEINDWLNIGDNINKPEPGVLDNVIANYTLDERRQFVIDAIFSKRDAVINSGVLVNNNTFFTDDASLNTMLQAITMQGLGISNIFPRNWILADGSIIEVTYDDIKAVAIAIAAKKDACYANYMALAAQIRASDNPESIDINVGWPA